MPIFLTQLLASLRWLRWMNPIVWYLDYRQRRDLAEDRKRSEERLERMEERELYRQTLLTMASMVEKAFQSSQSQAEVFKTWMDGFQTASSPQLREYDEQEEIKRFIEKRGGTPPELAGLGQLEKFEALLNKMETD